MTHDKQLDIFDDEKTTADISGDTVQHTTGDAFISDNAKKLRELSKNISNDTATISNNE